MNRKFGKKVNIIPGSHTSIIHRLTNVPRLLKRSSGASSSRSVTEAFPAAQVGYKNMDRRFGTIAPKYGKVVNFINLLGIPPLRWHRKNQVVELSREASSLQVTRAFFLIFHAIFIMIQTVKAVRGELGNNLFETLHVVRLSADFWLTNSNSCLTMSRLPW